MELVVDLHVHSHYARATSPSATLGGLYFWAKQKGINIIGTGDFTHPLWYMELREKLEPDDSGLLRLKQEYAQELDDMLPESVRNNIVRFVSSVEIATIYTKGGRVRKIHQLVIMPNLDAVAALNARLSKIGNLRADGRPILGMDSKELLRTVFEVDEHALFIPAHIWTPWFGLFGSKSGFDSIVEAYDELAPQIRAIETGFSSDPYMNWRLKQLDGVSITSHSDAHSPQKLGREATVLNCELSYAEMVDAIKASDKRLVGTIEFFPEEGKYHYDGHRACGVRFSPQETKKHNGLCPVCGKSLVVGVAYRVGGLADRPEKDIHANKTVEYIVPLVEVIAEQFGVKTTGAKRVRSEYDKLIIALGDEFSILRKRKIVDIAVYSPQVAEAIEQIRKGNVHREPGYDGVYGSIRVTNSAGAQYPNHELALKDKAR